MRGAVLALFSLHRFNAKLFSKSMLARESKKSGKKLSISALSYNGVISWPEKGTEINSQAALMLLEQPGKHAC